MKYEALICDVDGTLVKNSKDALPSERVKQAIHRAKKKAHIGIATGRPYLFVKEIIEAVELSSPCILGNGVQIYDPTSDTVVVEHKLPTKDLESVYQILSKLGVECTVQETEKRVPFSQNYQPDNPLYIFVPIFPEEKTNMFLDEISQIKSVIVHKMIAWESHKHEYLITNPAATKQQAILEVARILKISPKKIIGVGDGYNDFPLLMACGLKVAMGNAVDDLKAIADYVAPTVDDDGLAEVIDTYILNA